MEETDNSSWRSVDYCTAWWCPHCECYHDVDNPCENLNAFIVDKLTKILKIVRRMEKKEKS